MYRDVPPLDYDDRIAWPHCAVDGRGNSGYAIELIVEMTPHAVFAISYAVQMVSSSS